MCDINLDFIIRVMSTPLRQQKVGNQKPWTIEELEAGLKHFYTQHGHYPTATEVDSFPYLPSSKSIQRSHRGLLSVRKQLKLESNNDFRTGAHSSARAHVINKRNNVFEKEVYDFLVKRYGKPYVHREYFFSDDKRTRADFFVYDAGTGFCVDIFYASTKKNVLGCINSKLAKYASIYMRQYPIVFVQMNQKIGQGMLDTIMNNKKNKLAKDQQLMSWATFEVFCKKRKPL